MLAEPAAPVSDSERAWSAVRMAGPAALVLVHLNPKCLLRDKRSAFLRRRRLLYRHPFGLGRRRVRHFVPFRLLVTVVVDLLGAAWWQFLVGVARSIRFRPLDMRQNPSGWRPANPGLSKVAEPCLLCCPSRLRSRWEELNESKLMWSCQRERSGSSFCPRQRQQPVQFAKPAPSLSHCTRADSAQC